MIDLNIIYIDVLIVLNIYVNYFLLKATSRIAHSSIDTPGLVISSVTGSLFSLVILIPELNFFLTFIIKAAAAVIVVLMGFRRKSREEYIRLIVYFYIINFLFAGIIMGLRYFIKPEYLCINNSFVYIDVSLFSLIIFTALSYFLICGIRTVLDRDTKSNGSFSVIIKNGGSFVTLEGLSDTGNSVTDLFSGKPVIVCPADIINEFTGKNISSDEVYDEIVRSDIFRGTRLIPYSTIDGNGVLPAFRPDEVIIRGENIIRSVDVLVGLKETSGRAVFNPSILA